MRGRGLGPPRTQAETLTMTADGDSNFCAGQNGPGAFGRSDEARDRHARRAMTQSACSAPEAN